MSDDPPPSVVAPRRQYAALPYRRKRELEILLVTSRETHRWIIPKGWPMKRRKPHEAAAREALEEAGVTGDIAKRPFGAYAYLKRLPGGDTLDCVVDVFPMKVKRIAKDWPEHAQRQRRWFKVAEAIDAVDEPDLKALIEAFAALRVAKAAARRRVGDEKVGDDACYWSR